MILGISGGKEGGNTDALVKIALEECEKAGLEIKFVNVFNKNLKSCNDCGVCRECDCPIKDDMQGILDLLAKADGIIIGSPTYFANVSSRISKIMERSVSLRRQGFQLKDKIGGAIAVGGSRNGGQEFVTRTILNWFTLHGAIAIADGPPTAHFGGIGQGRKTGDAKNDEWGVKTSKNLGTHMAEVVKAMKA